MDFKTFLEKLDGLAPGEYEALEVFFKAYGPEPLNLRNAAFKILDAYETNPSEVSETDFGVAYNVASNV